MQIFIDDYTIEILLCPVYGLAVGVNYYNPTMDEGVYVEEEYYDDVTFLFVLFAIKIRWWKNQKNYIKNTKLGQIQFARLAAIKRQQKIL